MEVNYDEVVEELNPLTWTSVLKPVEVEVVTETGVGLCSLLAVPPPLEQLRLSEKDCPSFSKVPKTPVPRKIEQTLICFKFKRKLKVP